MSNRRVVITGMGMVTSTGIHIEDIWQSLIDGRPQIAEISSFDASTFGSSLGGEVKNFDIHQYTHNRKVMRFFRKDVQYCLASMTIASAASGIDFSTLNPAHVGLYVGSGEPTVHYNEFFRALDHSLNVDGTINCKKLGTTGLRYIDPFFLLKDLCNLGFCYLSIEHGIIGPNNNFSFGTSSGHAVGEGFHAIQRGDCDVAAVGGHDSLVSCFGDYFLHEARGEFTKAKNPALAMRPYSRDRDGFVPAEGAGMVILEEFEFARQRGADPIAELLGYYSNCDIHSDLQHPDLEGIGMAGAIEGALKDAGIRAYDLDYTNSIGDATIAGDLSETRALKKALGDAVYNIPVSTVKPVIGHTGAAADVIEMIVTALALKKGIIPPTLNYLGGDSECDLDYVPWDSREKPLRYAMSLGRGLLGQNCVLVLKRISD